VVGLLGERGVYTGAAWCECVRTWYGWRTWCLVVASVSVAVASGIGIDMRWRYRSVLVVGMWRGCARLDGYIGALAEAYAGRMCGGRLDDG